MVSLVGSLRSLRRLDLRMNSLRLDTLTYAEYDSILMIGNL